MKWAGIIIGALIALVLIVVGVGYALPVEHTASRSIGLNAAPADIWATITDVAAYPSWRSDVDSVEILAPVENRQAWREIGANGEISYVMTRLEPPSQMVTTISDRSLPFGGSWTYTIQPNGPRTRVTIVENGEVYNPVFRFMSRFVIGHTGTMDTYLRSLGVKFRETVEPQTAP